MITWSVTQEDHDLIAAIAHRAHRMSRPFARCYQYPIQDVMMDLTAVHPNTYPLRLRELLAAREHDFAHDVFGIRRHIDRATGELGGCFVPRFAWGRLGLKA